MSDRRMTRGACEACGRLMSLKKDGTLRHHRGKVWIDGKPAYHCEGSGFPPRKEGS